MTTAESAATRERRTAGCGAAVALLGLLVAAPFLEAQPDAASLAGRVVDAGGRGVPAARVLLRKTPFGLERAVETDEAGRYWIAGLPAGAYRLRVEADDGRAAERALRLPAGASLVVDLALGVEPKAPARTDDVFPREPRRTEEHGFVGPERIERLPVDERGIAPYALLLPGVTRGDGAVHRNFEPAKNWIPALSINGQNGRNLAVTVDGADTTDILFGGQAMALALGAVESLEVTTQRPGASQNRGLGGVVNIVTRSGTPDWQASGFAFFRSGGLRAGDPVRKRLGRPDPPFDAQELGGSVSGPLRLPLWLARSSLFYAYERQALDTAGTFDSRGAFAALDGADVPESFRRNLNTVKLTSLLGGGRSLTIRYAQQDHGFRGRRANESAAPESTSTDHGDANDLLVAFAAPRRDGGTHDLRLHVASYRTGTSSDRPPDRFATLVFPAASFGASLLDETASRLSSWEIRDELALRRGRHHLRLGGHVFVRPAVGFETTSRPSRFVFMNNDFDPSTGLVGPTNRALLLRTFSTATHRADNRTLTELGVFVEDDWTFRERLTFNLGLRYDLVHNLFYERDVAAARAVYEQLARRPSDDTNNFGPRLGGAFDVFGDGRTIVRMGWGRYHDTAAILSATLLEEADREDQPGGPHRLTIVPGALFDELGIAPGRPVSEAAVRRAVDLGLAFPLNFVNSPDLRVATTDQASLGVAQRVLAPVLGRVDLDVAAVFSRTTGLNAVLLTPEFDKVGIVRLNAPTGVSEYKAVQIDVRKRGGRWWLQAAYTLSSARASTSQFTYNPLDYRSPNSGEFGYTNFDERHRLVLSGTARLPYELDLGAVLLAASARPWTAGCDCDINGDGLLTNNGPTGSRTFHRFNGDRVEPRGARRGDPTLSLDLRLSRRMALDRLPLLGGLAPFRPASLELLVEVVNVTNAANFGQNFFDNVDDPERFGQPIATITPPRTARLGLRVEF